MMAEEKDLAVIRAVADLISEVREEFMDRTRESIERELKEIEATGFDPARGRGRGPRWADGG